MTTRTYSSYKPSGYDWIGTIPSHWTVSRLKFCASSLTSNVDKHINPGELPVTLCNYVDVYNNDFITAGLEFMPASATPAEIKKFLLKKGDVLITKDSESWDDIAVPASVQHDLDLVLCGYHLAIIRSRSTEFDAGYLFRQFCSQTLNYQFKVTANGVTRFGLPSSAIENAILLQPPLKEQRAISTFIDHETSRIDALAERKQRLIRLLEEKRRAVIAHAVTKGLNPQAPMRDSGVEWLGQMPAHWQVMELKRVADVEYGVGGEINTSLSEGINLISLPNVLKNGELDLTSHPYCELSEKDAATLMLRRGDLLFNWRNGSSEHLGKTAVFNADGLYTHVSFLLRLRVNDSHDSGFLRYFLNGLRATGFFASSKAGVNNTFNKEELKNLWIMLPPKDEQQEIVATIQRVTEQIDQSIGALARAITKLHEYRSALITDAVTGKIDVSGFVYEEAAA